MSVKFDHASLCSAAHKSSLMNVLCHRRALTVSPCHWLLFIRGQPHWLLKIYIPLRSKSGLSHQSSQLLHRNFKRFRKRELKSVGLDYLFIYLLGREGYLLSFSIFFWKKENMTYMAMCCAVHEFKYCDVKCKKGNVLLIWDTLICLLMHLAKFNWNQIHMECLLRQFQCC